MIGIVPHALYNHTWKTYFWNKHQDTPCQLHLWTYLSGEEKDHSFKVQCYTLFTFYTRKRRSSWWGTCSSNTAITWRSVSVRTFQPVLAWQFSSTPRLIAAGTSTPLISGRSRWVLASPSRTTDPDLNLTMYQSHIDQSPKRSTQIRGNMPNHWVHNFLINSIHNFLSNSKFQTYYRKKEAWCSHHHRLYWTPANHIARCWYHPLTVIFAALHLMNRI